MKKSAVCIHNRPRYNADITGWCTNSIFIKFNAAIGVSKPGPVGGNRRDIIGPFNFCPPGYTIIYITCHWISLVHAKPIRSSIRTNIAYRINGPHIEVIGYISDQEF